MSLRFECLAHFKVYGSSVQLTSHRRLTPTNSLFQFSRKYNLNSSRISRRRLLVCSAQVNGEGQYGGEPVDDLRVPSHWLDNSKACEETEWLRVTLLKWLDDEYCPEPTNVKISDIASRSFYRALMNKQTDLGEILLAMVRDLESISYQESFHGAFSSANAAIALIIQRIKPD